MCVCVCVCVCVIFVCVPLIVNEVLEEVKFIVFCVCVFLVNFINVIHELFSILCAE